MSDARQQAEWQVQIAVMDHWKARGTPGSLVWAVPNGGYILDKRTVAKLKAMGLTPGIPDLCVLVRGQKLLGLELKAGRGRQSPEQQAIEAAWIAAGGAYAVATGVDQALALLVERGALLPDRGARRITDLLAELDEAVP
jgi:hypothetical protein